MSTVSLEVEEQQNQSSDETLKVGERRLRHRRRVQVWFNNVWNDVRFVNLRVGNVFRMFESDGTQVEGPPGASVWKVLTEPDRVDGDLQNFQVEAVPISL